MAQDPLYGDTRSYIVSKPKMISASLKLTHWCELPLHVPQVELATLIWRGVEWWSHPSLLSITSIYGLISVPLLSYANVELLHTPNPPLRTFHPWSSMDIVANVHGKACSFLLTHPRGVLLAWCRVDARQPIPLWQFLNLTPFWSWFV